MWIIDNIDDNIDDDDEEKTESDIPLLGGPKSSIQVRALSWKIQPNLYPVVQQCQNLGCGQTMPKCNGADKQRQNVMVPNDLVVKFCHGSCE